MIDRNDNLEGSRAFAFGPFVLVPDRQLLFKHELAVRIGGRAFDLLATLVARAGQTVSKADLIESAWPGLVVEDANLKVNIGILRKVLGDDVNQSSYIVTISGRGYRFIMPVQTVSNLPDLNTDEIRKKLPAAHNLPISFMRVFGRTEFIKRVRRDLEGCRLVAIVGPGGIGKTTVALQVAEQEVENYPDGVWLIELSALENPDNLPSALATSIGVMADSPNVLEAVCEYLRDRTALLVFDSCEHLLTSVADCVRTILASAPRTRVLATTREQLRVSGERVRRLGGLDFPVKCSTQTAADALQYSAVQLFVDRVSDGLETFVLTEASVQSVVAICRKLDGHALALELAATRVGSLGLNGVLKQLEDQLSTALGGRSGPERHRTLSATIDWSYKLLTEVERTVLQRLSIFAGPFSLDGACEIAGDSALASADIVDALAGLVEKSLIAAEVRDVDVAYRLWDATRSYALGKLSDNGADDRTRLRHAEYLLRLITEGVESGLRVGATPLTQLLAEVRTASDWAFSREGTERLGIELTICAIPIWKRLSLAEECRVATQRALEPRYAAYRTQFQEMILLETLSATILDVQGTLPDAKSALEAALEIAVALNDAERQLECLRGLSEYELWTGDSHAALALAERMRHIEQTSLATNVGADAGVGSALEWLGDLEGARRHLARALGANRHNYARFDNERFEFNQRLLSQVSMTHVLWMQGFADQAQEVANSMRNEADSSNYAWSYCFSRFQSATLALHMRDYELGKKYIDAGMSHAAKHGITFWRSTVAAGGLARWKLYLGHVVDLAEMRAVLKSMRERGSRMYYPHILTNYGEALARQDNLQDGLAAIDDAIEMCRTTGQIVVIPEILRIKGNVIRWQDPKNWRKAEDCYLEAITRAQEDCVPAWEIRAATSLVKLLRAQGGSRIAEEMLEAAFMKFAEGFETGDLRRARRLLDTRPK